MKKQLLTIAPDKLYLDGEEFYLASGDFHYFRTMQGGWRHRLRLMKAFGLTAVQTYVPWNLHEPEIGEFHFEGRLDLRRFIEMCGEEGLYVMLRPSPYICSECDYGGLPYFLMREPGMCPRTTDEAFMAHYRRYFARLCEEFVPLLSTNGGPIIAVALENEYGSFGMDLEYIRALERMYREAGINVPLYTAGGPDLYKQKFGGFPEIWSGIDLRNNVPAAAASLRKFQKDFPVYASELWGGCAQQWGGVFPRQTPDTVAKNYKEALDFGAYVNFYMFCGGTSFGFFSGALHATFRADVRGAKNRFIPFTTSYDVDAPVSEDGRATEKFMQCRAVLAAYRGMSVDALPPVPENPPVQIPEAIEWHGTKRLFAPDALDALTTRRVKSGNVRTMEDLGQDYGYILYSARILQTDPESKHILHIDGLHDRADIYVDGVLRGTCYRDRDCAPVEFRVEGESARLDILVENMGRINYGYSMLTDRKGIQECVRLDVKYDSGSTMYNRAIVTNWEIRTLPMKDAAVASLMAEPCADANAEPRFHFGSFAAKPGVDAFLRFRVDGLTKGFVCVNGFNLGRYWAIGPQDTLYIPGELLREQNEITIFEQYSDGSAPKAVFVPSHELDSIQTNAELVLAPRA